ncbi:hypothetical protein ACJIZ3_010955 [Penstemon smallii]|uniref:Uncharacterized protein n=1 Tax=Penstemon smallii TaxID=265156 RepID=A0ABD3UL02_9LAMI
MLDKLLEPIFSAVGQKLVDFGADKIKGKDSKSILKTLKRNLKSLSAKASDVEEQINNGEQSGKKKRKREVENWLEEVKVIEAEVRALGNEVQEEGFISRFFGGDQATELNERVNDLVEESRHFGELLLTVYETRGTPMLTTKLFGKAFDENLERIWKCVVIDKVPTIGIYGMGGVGKTTLTKHIYNRLLEKTQYRVYWVTVSHEFSINKLQDEIAKVIGLDLSAENDEDKRSGLLNIALSRKKEFVLVLDDVWDNISLIKVGNPQSLESARLIITTRSLEVCRQIGCKENFIVETLWRDEAWDLFQETLGQETTLSPRVKEIAKSMAKECYGLPLGIITVAGSMRGVTDIHVWRNTITELKESILRLDGMEDKVFGVLKYSFDRLDPHYKREYKRKEYTKLQLCFLYCSLYPEDYYLKKDELISKFISEKLMDKRKTRKAEVDQGHTIIDRLVNVCLLEIDAFYHVKMHDLVREMAHKITRGNPKFMVLARLSLKEIPSEEEYWTEDLEKMSLMENEISEIPEGMSPNCPILSTLLLNKNRKLTLIGDSFFSLLCGLCILDLSHTNITKLPDSVSELKRLNALNLTYCCNLVFVPNLGKLTALRELDLSVTAIKEVPQGMENLVNLRFLSLQYIPIVDMLMIGLLPKFKYLQCLYLPNSIQVPVEEIESLKRLEKFYGRVNSVCDLNRIIQFRQSVQGYYTTCFHFLITPGVELKMELAVGNDHIAVVVNGFFLIRREVIDLTLLEHDIQHLEYKSFIGLSLLDELPRLNNPRSLKTLRINDCREVECILSRNEQQLIMSREKLKYIEEIHLRLLRDLMCVVANLEIEEDVFATPPPPPPPLGIFSSLRELSIQDCHKMKKLGLPLPDLQNLESLAVGMCYEIEEIIQGEIGGIVSLPKLKKLYLADLPKLKSICEATMVCNSIELISLGHCPLLKKLPLFLPVVDDHVCSPPPTLQRISVLKWDKEWWESLEWDHSTHKDILQPFLFFHENQFEILEFNHWSKTPY